MRTKSSGHDDGESKIEKKAIPLQEKEVIMLPERAQSVKNKMLRPC